MPKMQLNWHREAHKNRTQYLFERHHSLEQQMLDLERSEQQNEFTALQITEAEKRGLDAFDADKFLVKRKVLKPLK